MRKKTRNNIEKIIASKSPKSSDKFWNGIRLCNECKKLGYCKREVERSKARNAQVDYNITDQEISNFVWLQVPKGIHYYGDFSRKYLQIAFDAFHQLDYETAIINSKVVLDEKRDCGAALFCIAASNYFLGEYETAVDYARRAFQKDYYDISVAKIEGFIQKCQGKLKANNQPKTEKRKAVKLNPILSKV